MSARVRVTALALGLLGGVASDGASQVTSHINTIRFDGEEQRTLLTVPRHFEAPNWSPDGAYLLLNSRGRLYRLPLVGGEPELVHTGSVTNVNNDHGISADGRYYVVSAGHMYIMPASGGEPRQITQRTPSYYHGWSPDGGTLAYCAPRNENFDIYAIPVAGGEEQRLTAHPAFDDGPDYSPDGRWIYFNSDRSGSMEIWRIAVDGEAPDARAQQITDDEHENWFPHPSPDGRWLVMLSYAKGTEGHPANRNVALRIMPLPADAYDGPAPARELVRLFGGQGTINVNSWSPDGRYLAYVSYPLEADPASSAHTR
jgi:TolB protein